MMDGRLFPKDYYQVTSSICRTRRKTQWFCNRPLSPVINETAKLQEETISSSDTSMNIEKSVLSDDKGQEKSDSYQEISDSYQEIHPENSSGSEYCPSDSETTSSNETNYEETNRTQTPSVSSKMSAPQLLSIYNTQHCDLPLDVSTDISVEEMLPTATNDANGKKKPEGEDLFYGKRHRQKDFCYFCESLVQCFARHIIRNHFQEIEVQKVLSYPPKNKTRNHLIAMLRKKGNYLNSGQTQKPVKKGMENNELLPCSHCFGFYSKRQLWKHRKKCNENLTTKNSQIDAQNFMIKYLKIDDELKTKVFPRMRPDSISLTAKMDKLICAFGARYLKLHREVHFINVVSRKMRELARLTIQIKNIDSRFKDLFQILRPENFDLIVQATKNVANYDNDTELYKSPTYARNISTSLKQCCDIIILCALKKKDIYGNVSSANVEADVKTLIHLLNENWKFEVSSQASNTLNMNKWNKVSIIPLASDLKLFKDYLIKRGNQAVENLVTSTASENDYKTLIETVYCRVILLNRRRPGELQRLLLKSYQNYSTNKQNYEEFEGAVSATEKILMGRFKRLVIRGKRGRGVPVLFSTDVQEHIDLLIKYRPQFLKRPNPYLFSNISSLQPISGYKVLQKYASSCGAKNPEGITCTKLRKHLATLSQVFNMSESDLEQLATFMGHTVGIHRHSYRLPDDVYQTSKITKILLLMEKGEIGNFQGKTIDEINIDMEEDLLAETSEENEPVEPTEIEPVVYDSMSNAEVAAKNFENITSTSEKLICPKKERTLIKWTEEQKQVVVSYFTEHIKNRKPPKKAECENLIQKHKELLKNKDWLKIKVYIQNKYSGKCK